jgi:hypothetical protein
MRILITGGDEEGISHGLEDAIAGDEKTPTVTYLHQQWQQVNIRRWHSFVHAALHSGDKTFVVCTL